MSNLYQHLKTKRNFYIGFFIVETKARNRQKCFYYIRLIERQNILELKQ